MKNGFLQRNVLLSFTILAALLVCPPVWGQDSSASSNTGEYELSTFSVDVTPPLGHPLIAGLRKPAQKIRDPLYARGFVLFGAGKPIVLVAVDWCELRNDAYDRWRKLIAQAVETDPKRVLLSCVHQHDSPLADLEAQKLLDRHGLQGAMFDPEFHEQTVQKVAQKVQQAVRSRHPVTHLGIGQAKVEKVASNRRVVMPDGTVTFGRYSSTQDEAIKSRPEGTIDPWLKTISFWNEDQPVAAMSSYATHPMSYYGRGGVSADFVGRARARMQKEHPEIFQIYLSGCSGDVTAGKYNEANDKSRKELAHRLYQALEKAWKATRRVPLKQAEFRSTPLRLEPRTTGEYTLEAQEKTLADPTASKRNRILAAMGLSWRKRVAASRPIDLPVVDFGEAQFLLMPAEMFVGYQLAVQKMRPDSFVMVAGYGECAPGYIPTHKTRKEGFAQEHGWCWVAPGVEKTILSAVKSILKEK